MLWCVFEIISSLNIKGLKLGYINSPLNVVNLKSSCRRGKSTRNCSPHNFIISLAGSVLIPFHFIYCMTSVMENFPKECLWQWQALIKRHVLTWFCQLTCSFLFILFPLPKRAITLWNAFFLVGRNWDLLLVLTCGGEGRGGRRIILGIGVIAVIMLDWHNENICCY